MLLVLLVGAFAFLLYWFLRNKDQLDILPIKLGDTISNFKVIKETSPSTYILDPKDLKSKIPFDSLVVCTSDDSKIVMYSMTKYFTKPRETEKFLSFVAFKLLSKYKSEIRDNAAFFNNKDGSDIVIVRVTKFSNQYVVQVLNTDIQLLDKVLSDDKLKSFNDIILVESKSIH